MHITHNPSDQAFTVEIDGHEGELTYARPSDGVIDFQHTWVDEMLRGRGIADALANSALTFARQHQLTVRLTCPFMRTYVQRHPEWADLLENKSA